MNAKNSSNKEPLADENNPTVQSYDMTNTLEETSAVDAVFVIGTGSKNGNEELRYALRNLERNCPFVRNVYISGEFPDWVSLETVIHLPWADRFTHAKDANIIDKLRHACEHPTIAQNILFCSDDQFQTRACSWDDFSPRWLRQYTPNDSWYDDRRRVWHTRLRKTLERDRVRRKDAGLDEKAVYYYQPHMWMQIDRDKFVEYAKWCDYEHCDSTIIASGYFNFIDAGGQQNFDHIFISPSQTWPVNETHVAYSDPSFHAAMRYLKDAFPEPSRFEKGFEKKADRPADPTVINIPYPSDSFDSFNSSDSEHPDSPADRTDEDIIRAFKEKISGVEVWKRLEGEMDLNERLRRDAFVGWRKVWNDTMRRWSVVTDHGKRHMPIMIPRSEEANKIVLDYLASTGNAVPRNTAGSAAGADAPKKGCTSCAARKRHLIEQRGTDDAQTARSVRRLLGNRSANTGVTSGWACLSCAVEHLSAAVAYMGSNAGRPGALDVELAKGEVSVAARHLLDLGQDEAYNRCVNALDSATTEKSLFSVLYLRETLGQLVDGGAA